MKSTLTSAVILTYITAFLYTASLAHFNGYLIKLGIEPEFISRTTESILYYSIFVVGLPLIIGGIFVWLIVTVTSLVFMILFRGLITSFRFRRFIVRIKKKKNINTFIELEITLYKVSKYLMIIFMTPLILFSIMAFFEYEGKKEAKDVLNKLRNNKLQDKNITVLSDKNEKLFIVACGINNCAGINVDTKEIVYFERKINNFSGVLK